jgi:hypothetical protein
MSAQFENNASTEGRRTMSKISSGAAVICAALVASACTSSHPPTASTTPATTKATATAAHPAKGYAAASIPSSIANDPKVRKSVILSECAPVAGGWHAAGHATNPGTTPIAYAVTVFFTTESATTLNYAETTVKVAPGQRAAWSVNKSFAGPKSMRCVLRGVSVK